MRVFVTGLGADSAQPGDKDPHRSVSRWAVDHIYHGAGHYDNQADQDAERADGPPRIGFVSRFFRDHSIGRLMGNLIGHLADRGLDITVFAFPQEGDAVWKEIRAKANTEILPLALDAARRQIARGRTHSV